MTVIYGIKNCDTIKKALRWLGENKIDYKFHDYRRDGIDQALLESFQDQIGWEALLNKRSTTWRKLDDDTKNAISRASALALMLEQPALIKRPVLVSGDSIRVGFKAEEYESLLNILR